MTGENATIVFREATSADVVTLLQFEQYIVAAERPFNPLLQSQDAKYYDLPALIANDRSLLMIGEVDKQIIATGYVDIRQSKGSLIHEYHGYLGFMYVLENHRGKGVNKSLIERLITWAKAQRVDHFYLDVYEQNVTAIRAYEKLGFKPSLLEMQLVT